MSNTVVSKIAGTPDDIGQLRIHGDPEGTEADIQRAVVKLVEEKYQNFRAEYGVKDGDIVVHFYLPLDNPEVLGRAGPRTKKSWNSFWLERFPQVLSPVAKEYFQADRPRIGAQYTPEVVSWWFYARGFGSQLLSPLDFAAAFLGKLDAALSSEPLPTLDGN